ncbi:MAG: YeeE/YedE family protein [candidate division NC10 bacterium]|nr:YeeE/YedE family protein [candidate division NC10 bacterium]
MRWLRREEWSWWHAGLLLGLLNMAAFYTADHYLAVSTTFSRAAGMAVGVVAPTHVAANLYWQKVNPIVDWQFMLVLGIPLGAYLAARLSQRAVTFTTQLPDLWVNRFGTSSARRWTLGLLGGIFVGFGARLADG